LAYRRQYLELKSEWCGVQEVFERPDIVEERHRIDVDCRRTDRSQPLFAAAPSPEPSPAVSRDSTVDADAMRYSVMSPNFADIGAQSPSNEHIERLAAILLTYNFYEKELGQYTLHLILSEKSELIIKILKATSRACPTFAPLYTL
jgi:TBC1 domain family member 15